MPPSRQTHQQNNPHHTNAVANLLDQILATQWKSAPAACFVNSDNEVPTAPPNTINTVAASNATSDNPPHATPNATYDADCDSVTTRNPVPPPANSTNNHRDAAMLWNNWTQS